MADFFLNDKWLSSQIATPSTDTEQNYYHVNVNGDLELAFKSFANCLNSSVIGAPVAFEGWEVNYIPTDQEHDWQFAIYAEGIGYIIAANNAGVGATGYAMTSTDGAEWTALTTPTANAWNGITYAESEGLIIVATNFGGGYNFITSNDAGVTWTEHTTGLGNPNLVEVLWVPEKSIYVAYGWSGAIYYSTDLITWGTGTISTGGGYWDTPTAVTYAPSLGKLCAIGFFGNVWLSTDGMSWTFQSLGGGNWDSGWDYLTWSPSLSLFVAQGEHHSNYTNQDMFISSPDGITWTQRPLGIALVQHNTVNTDTFLPVGQVKWDSYTSKFYALTKADNNSGNGNSLMTPSMLLLTSPNGITWTIDITVPSTHMLSYPVFGTNEFRDVAFKDADNMIMINKHSVVRRI